MKAALYARVSTRDQSADMQRSEFREYCMRREWEIAAEYCEMGVSGSRASRPQLNRMMAEAKRRQFDAVVVYRLDRLARSLKQLINVLDEFRALGIEFVSLHDQIDTSTPAGKLQFSILGAFAEFERGIIQERVRSGIEAARKSGKQLGRPKLTIDKNLVLGLIDGGVPLRGISKQLNISVASVHRIGRQGVQKPQI